MDKVMRAARSAVVDVDGTRHRIRRGRTLAHPDAPVVATHPHLWVPLTIDHPAPAAAPAKAPAKKAAASRKAGGSR